MSVGTPRGYTASSLIRRPLPFLVLAAALLLLISCRQPFDPGFKFVLVSQEIAVEQARFTFVLLDQSEHAIEDARVSVDFLPPGDYPAPPKANAVYRKISVDDVRMSASKWYDADVEIRGIYTVDQPPFDRPGEWELRVSILHGDFESPVEIESVVRVLEESSTPKLGERVSPIEHRTGADVADLTELSTSPDPLPEMYQTSVGEALGEGQALPGGIRYAGILTEPHLRPRRRYRSLANPGLRRRNRIHPHRALRPGHHPWRRQV